MARAFELDYDGTRKRIETERALAVAHAGVPVIVEGALQEIGHLTRIVDLYLDVIGAVASPIVAADLRARGLERMHDLLDPDQVVEILTRLNERAAALAVPVASALFELTTSPPRPHYFICGRMFVRAQVPYRLVENSPDILQTGHLYGHLLPVEPHRDYLLTHPRGTLSLWSAVGPVATGNTVTLFEGSDTSPGRALTPALTPGDVLVFNSDGLHASVRNKTDETRVAIGVRVALGRRLRFGSGTHWRPWYDPALLDTPLAPFATLQSRLTPAALRRWRWQRKVARERQALSTTTDA